MKNVQINKYLVPYDFTETTKDALRFALKIATKGGGSVDLVYIAKDAADENEKKREFKKITDQLLGSVDVKVTYSAIEGDLYDDLGKIAEAREASAIVMGTHGRSGLRKIFGSNALKVVAESHIPFILTQEHQEKSNINNIVMPFNFQRESVQITQFASSLAAKFNATIHLVGYEDKDASLLQDMKVNQAIVQKHLTQHNINYKVIHLDGEKPYQEELLEYANNLNADLIAAAYFDHSLRGIFHSFVDELIENEYRIPVMTVNGPDVMNHSPKLNYVPV